MSIDRRLLQAALAIVVALAIAACGSPTPALSTAAPTTASTASGDRTPGPSAAPALAAMLPDSAGGIDFVKSSFTGSDLEGAGISLDAKVLETLAKAQGKTLADVQIAEARPVAAATSGIVLAIRVPGADPKAVVDATFSHSKALQGTTLGGKTVFNVGASGLNVVVYLKDDVMFQVVGAPSALTEAIITELP
ncbi:MAG: hypothetical protein ABIR11_12910 [Candidatus Limnocylindrales bacterium]